MEEKAPRIDAEITGGCGMSVNISLIFDEPRPNDNHIAYKGITINIDTFTKRYLDDITQVDYTEEQGFVIGKRWSQTVCAIQV